MTLKKILFAAFLTCSISAFSQTWQNPLVLDGEWFAYGIGDPYVLKHNGVFYLYCSTKDWETGVKTFSSKDLMNWTYEGLCSTDPITQSAYAPEVFYWNGMFYMYTSPAGNGHFVLSSDSPAGPFTAASSNIGKWIDGSIYIDHDASWQFLHASPWGIQGCEMDSPVSFGESVSLNAQMNNSWTEGPCMFWRNGRYYMIYTGNHLRTTGYRIDYGSNTSGPLEPFTPASSQNPILLRTMGDHVGLGHGSVFIGPDLDSYFLTYHNMERSTGWRHLNFDRIAWNGDKMILLGATDFEQQGASLPDAYDYFHRESVGEGWSSTGGQWQIVNQEYLSQDTTLEGSDNYYLTILDSISESNFTAEFNFRETFRNGPGASLGAVFSYTDEENYGVAKINSEAGTLEVNFLVNNSWGSPQTTEMPAELDYSKWHCLRIEKYENEFRFFVDHMLKISTIGELQGGKIGYLTLECHGNFGFVAFSNKVNSSGVFDVYKPLPGTIDAVLYNRGGEGVGYHEEIPGTENNSVIRSDGTEIIECPRGGYAIRSFKTGDWYAYHVNARYTGLYNCEIIYAAGSDPNSIRISMDDADVSGVLDLPSTGGTDKWRSFVVKDIPLPGGYHTMKVEALSGDMDYYSIRFTEADNDPFDEKWDFEFSFGKGWEHRDGPWLLQDGDAVVDGYGKRTVGSSAWTDYTVDTDMMLSRRRDAGIIFRVNNPATGGAGDNPELGTNFFQGYFVGFSPSNVILYKHNYDKKLLTTGPGSYPLDTWFHLRVVAEGNRFRIFVDDMVNPKIDYTDTIPMINGMAGIRAADSNPRFDNFRVTSTLLTTSDRDKALKPKNNRISIYPNPSSAETVLDLHTTLHRNIQIIDTHGAILYSYTGRKQEIVLPAQLLPPGVYLVRSESKTGVGTAKMIIH